MAAPRIGIDARRAAWMPATGIGQYVAQVLAHRDADSRVRFVPLLACGQQLPDMAGVVRRRPSGVGPAARIAWEQFTVPALARRLDLDLLHLPWYEGSPAWGPLVLTIHDLDSVIAPQDYPGRFRLYYNRLLKPLATRARRIVVPSEATAESLARLGPRIQAKARVVPYGHDEQLVDIRRAGGGFTGRRVLYCGGYAPRKRIDVLLRAFARVRSSIPDAQLILVGSPPAEVFAMIGDLGLRGSVEVPGTVSRAELRGEFARADALAYPSDWEGFGFPLLEALTAGVPAAVTAAGSLPELAGGCALLVEPGDAGQLADALIESLDAGPAVLRRVAAGVEHARRLTWAQTVKGHASVYLEAIS